MESSTSSLSSVTVYPLTSPFQRMGTEFFITELMKWGKFNNVNTAVHICRILTWLQKFEITNLASINTQFTVHLTNHKHITRLIEQNPRAIPATTSKLKKFPARQRNTNKAYKKFAVFQLNFTHIRMKKYEQLKIWKQITTNRTPRWPKWKTRTRATRQVEIVARGCEYRIHTDMGKPSQIPFHTLQFTWEEKRKHANRSFVWFEKELKNAERAYRDYHVDEEGGGEDASAFFFDHFPFSYSNNELLE